MQPYLDWFHLIISLVNHSKLVKYVFIILQIKIVFQKKQLLFRLLMKAGLGLIRIKKDSDLVLVLFQKDSIPKIKR